MQAEAQIGVITEEQVQLTIEGQRSRSLIVHVVLQAINDLSMPLLADEKKFDRNLRDEVVSALSFIHSDRFNDFIELLGLPGLRSRDELRSRILAGQVKPPLSHDGPRVTDAAQTMTLRLQMWDREWSEQGADQMAQYGWMADEAINS